MGDLNGSPGAGGGRPNFAQMQQQVPGYGSNLSHAQQLASQFSPGGAGHQQLPSFERPPSPWLKVFQQNQGGNQNPYTPGGVTDQVRARQGMSPWGQAPQGGSGFPKQ